MTVSTQTDISNSVEDVIHCKGIRLQFHLELDPHQSQFIFKIFVVKSAKGNIPTDGISSTLFVNLTGNNLMDYVNKRRYKIKVKTVKITSTNLTTVGGIVVTELDADQVSAKPDDL